MQVENNKMLRTNTPKEQTMMIYSMIFIGFETPSLEAIAAAASYISLPTNESAADPASF